jgi:hypothetical protein
MNRHPAEMMLVVWGLCIVAFVLLPFQLLERDLTVQGAVIFAIFVVAYLVGTLIVPTRKHASLISPPIHVDARRAEAWLMVASGLATVLFILDAREKSLFDLAVAYELRSETADALLKGEASKSSIWFQIAFLIYPAGYIYTAVHALYARHIKYWRFVVFGLLPIALATVAMGGRMPIFYAVIVAWIALRERKKFGCVSSQSIQISIRRKWIARTIWLFVLMALLYYFAAVFMIRAAVVGGSMEMFDVAELRWGVGFRGAMSEIIFSLFGEDIAYLIFIFAWYLVQGVVMSNYLFSVYDGPLQMGTYGVDLMTALMRQLDPQRVAEGFDSLLSLGTYGFFPSAWGSLYVDFGFFAIILCIIWGMFTALCYRRIVVQRRMDWLLVGPFASIGIFFSIINTPLGFTNGFVTHAWLLVAFLLLKRQQAQQKSPRHEPFQG